MPSAFRIPLLTRTQRRQPHLAIHFTSTPSPRSIKTTAPRHLGTTTQTALKWPITLAMPKNPLLATWVRALFSLSHSLTLSLLFSLFSLSPLSLNLHGNEGDLSGKHGAVAVNGAIYNISDTTLNISQVRRLLCLARP